ncbi:hypothetical protein [Microbacterium sp. CJ88]|uniref:hypothetical protein n=1 Tax=Microbacterium sp. CJ88 TaxID=3445672 RepID=UPI003F658674
MSAASVSAATASSIAPSRRGADATPRRLRALDAPARRRPRVAYAVIALTGAVLIGGAQMVLSILMTQGSYEIANLTQSQREVTWQKQILNDDVAGLSSPQYLAANAAALGMVITESPSYLRLSDGAILGPGQAAVGTSSIDALGRGSVANKLISQTPLITAPSATIQGVPTPAPDPNAVAPGTGPATGVANTPPPITDGLPSPATH